MGEYANHITTGKRIKLGTCEDLMYVTRLDIERLIQDGWTGDGCYLGEYLKRPFFCRLPILESPGNPDIIDDRKPEGPMYRIDICANLADVVRDQVNHSPLYYYPIQGTNTRLSLPCPMSKAADPEWFKNNGFGKVEGAKWQSFKPYVQLCNEGLGESRAIYRCPFCHGRFNLRGHDLQGLMLGRFNEQYPGESSTLNYLRDLVGAGMTAAV